MHGYTRRNFLKYAGVGAAALAALETRAVPAAEPQSQPPRPNILLVLSDDHSAPYLGCYGDKVIRTPTLDRFAAAGMRFDRAYTTCPQCVPSRSSIMTGRSPIAIQMTRFTAPLAAEVVTWPEILRTQGYYTGICRRYFHLDGPAVLDPAGKAFFEKHGLKTFEKRVDFLRVDSQRHTEGGREATVAVMNEFFDGLPKTKPFFLWVSFNDPHRPYDKNAIPQPHDPAQLVLPPHFPDLPSLREDLARYYDEIGRLDGEFAGVLGVLEKRGFAENTIVIFMGDNGGALLRGKGTLYELGCHVPLLVRWPGAVKPGASAELISGEDLAPTFIEAAGASVPPSMTGRSFLKLLRGEPFEGRKYVFTQRSAHGAAPPLNTASFDLGRAVRTKTHRLIYNALWQLPYWPVDFAGQPFWKEMQELHAAGKLGPEFERLYFSPQRPMFELFDLQNDPYEFRNLIGKPEAAAVERELKKVLEEWMILERDYLPLPIIEGAPAMRKSGQPPKDKVS